MIFKFNSIPKAIGIKYISISGELTNYEIDNSYRKYLFSEWYFCQTHFSGKNCKVIS